MDDNILQYGQEIYSMASNSGAYWWSLVQKHCDCQPSTEVVVWDKTCLLQRNLFLFCNEKSVIQDMKTTI